MFEQRFRFFSCCAALLLICGAAVPVTSAVADSVFEDGFESADLSHSANGFRWLSPNNTSVVQDDGLQQGRQWENGPASDGSHALRFRFGAGSSMSEQRFDLGGVYPEIWISYWIRVPINFRHGSIGTPPGYRNQKWFALWTDKYSGSGQPVVVFNFWDERDAWSADGSSGSSYSTVSISNATNISSGHREKFPDFIRFPRDQGRWMHVVARYKIASARGAEDGIVQWWRRWEDESAYTQLANRTNLGIGTDTGPAGFTAGYLLGWANGAYEDETEFLVDDFTVSTTSLLGTEFTPPNSPEPASVE